MSNLRKTVRREVRKVMDNYILNIRDSLNLKSINKKFDEMLKETKLFEKDYSGLVSKDVKKIKKNVDTINKEIQKLEQQDLSKKTQNKTKTYKYDAKNCAEFAEYIENLYENVVKKSQSIHDKIQKLAKSFYEKSDDYKKAKNNNDQDKIKKLENDIKKIVNEAEMMMISLSESEHSLERSSFHLKDIFKEVRSLSSKVKRELKNIGIK